MTAPHLALLPRVSTTALSESSKTVRGLTFTWFSVWIQSHFVSAPFLNGVWQQLLQTCLNIVTCCTIIPDNILCSKPTWSPAENVTSSQSSRRLCVRLCHPLRKSALTSKWSVTHSLKKNSQEESRQVKIHTKNQTIVYYRNRNRCVPLNLVCKRHLIIIV